MKNKPSVLVDELKLNRYSKVATSHKNLGYAMTMKIMPLLFSSIEMAMSRGQGLAPPAKGYFRPPLDQEGVTTLRGIDNTRLFSP
ncbi:hypothetical protein FSP39_011808 [Pinctada imbricata]|uniref:Uncharacterized protein n=1 Tax=Pinctada imbricata TaxID=66713 RepID=A0AA88YNH6_PINIB|nr:hypothetical protein FSP39_011808 [Pinctada imbricata]